MASVGPKGDSNDDALAETVHGLYKAELLHRRGSTSGSKTPGPATVALLPCSDRTVNPPLTDAEFPRTLAVKGLLTLT
ncbi:MAG: hypothetical protein KatS3mg014_2191 [Actinomycetota bacterium]|nr:MAG: hypothetical protein KatS3mg014_2191 [Actinomycetota bacterium]